MSPDDFRSRVAKRQFTDELRRNKTRVPFPSERTVDYTRGLDYGFIPDW